MNKHLRQASITSELLIIDFGEDEAFSALIPTFN